MHKALVLGELCIDIIIIDPRSVPVFNTPLWSKNIISRLGGSASYAAQGLKALGVDVKINSYVGNDWITKHFLNELKEKGINLSQVLIKDDIATPTCVCISDKGRKKFISCSPFSPYPKNLMDLPIEDENLIYFGGYTLYPELWDGSLAGFFRKAESQVLIVVDTQCLPVPVNEYKEHALSKENMQYIDVLMVNQAESQLFTDCNNPIDAARKLSLLGPHVVVVKLGSEGCLVWTEDKCVKSRSFKSSVGDLVGAGDLFGAAFSYGCLEGWDLQYTSDFANTFVGLSMERIERVYPDVKTTKSFVDKKVKNEK